MSLAASQNLFAPYNEFSSSKSERLLRDLNKLTQWHLENCPEYRRIINAIYGGVWQAPDIASVPFLPVRLFKRLDLLSVPRDRVIKTLSSSGTSSQQPSKIYLDKETSLQQSRALTAIVRSFLGPKRLPIAIIDCPAVLKDRHAFSARGAGILGFSQFGYDHTYLLSDNMELNWDVALDFIQRHAGERILLFGFTFMIWKYLYEVCVSSNRSLKLSKSILIHGGGWKKLLDIRISNSEFKRRLAEVTGIPDVHNYYGMVEQTGSIFMECENGYFHCSSYSDIQVRDPDTLRVSEYRKLGLLQVMSTIPRSYPGHSLLTEDLGTILGEDDCACGRAGKYFSVEGRLPSSELRGCSDTHQVNQ